MNEMSSDQKLLVMIPFCIPLGYPKKPWKNEGFKAKNIWVIGLSYI